jgi:hypothetical protein
MMAVPELIILDENLSHKVLMLKFSMAVQRSH